MSLATVVFWLIAALMISALFKSLKWPHQTMVLVGVLMAGFIPLGPLNVMQHWQSFVGQLSVLSLCWFAHRVIYKETIAYHQRYVLLAVSLSLLLFYLFALGFSALDPYRWGFNAPATLIIASFIIISLTIYLRAWPLSAALIAALAAFAFELLLSTNFWDYFVDPILLIALLVQTIKLFLPSAKPIVEIKSSNTSV